MTEPQIRALAARHGLDVLKRITTGNVRAHFATFEVFGHAAYAAWLETRKEEDRNRLRGEVPLTRFLKSDAGPGYFIEFPSVWCEPAEEPTPAAQAPPQ